MATTIRSGPEAFITACHVGRAKPADAVAYIERRQSTDTDGTHLSKYLGMTDVERGLYMEAERHLTKILADRRVQHYPAPKASMRRRGGFN